MYKDAILNKRDLRIALTEIWGGLADGTVHEIDEMARLAARDVDATNYANSNAPNRFKTHWTRLLGVKMMAAIGRVMCNAAPLVNAASPSYTSAAHVPIPPQDQDRLDFLWPPSARSEVADTAQGEDGTDANETCTAHPAPRPTLARSAHATTPNATNARADASDHTHGTAAAAAPLHPRGARAGCR